MINSEILLKNNITEREDFQKSKLIFEDLIDHMKMPEVQSRLEDTHKLNALSSQIQEIILNKAMELGFKSEKTGLFENYPVKQLRPDYFLDLKNKKGITMEVERGKTIANNMDLLDLWKCHICENANYLFLIVPNIRQTAKGGKNIIFETVKRRITTFFNKVNYTNVDGVFIIGY